MRGAMEKSATCRVCGRDFAPHRRAGLHAYCKRCTAKADKEIARRISVDCKECGKTFPTKTRSVRNCSAKCRADTLRRAARERYHRDMADPEKHTLATARSRARYTARKGGKKGRGGPRGA